jgi:hypothetical protein
MGRREEKMANSQIVIRPGRSQEERLKKILLLFVFITLLTHPAFAGIGSNLGDYGTNFSPAVLSGQVTDGNGNPISGATVSTIAGHTTTTDANGNYTLYLDAPGIYTVTAQHDTNTATKTGEVFLGTTTTLNFQLGISQYTLTVAKAGSGTGTVTSDPSGIDCGSDCTEVYEEGTAVVLTATPDSGSDFAGWSGGGCSGTGDCTVTLTADITVTATFSQSGCPVTTALQDTPQRETKLTILYAFRDKVLAQTPKGQQYIRWFYRYAPEGTWHLLRHPELRAQARDVLEEILPALEAAVAGQPVILTTTDVAIIDDLLEAIAAYASPGLQQKIRRFQTDLRSGKLSSLLGINVDAKGRRD